MSSRMPIAAVPLVLGAILLAGCGPRHEPGPAPLSSAGRPLQRLRETRGSFNTRYQHTLWDFGDRPVEPMDRIRTLRDALPAFLKKKLETRQTAQVKPGGPKFDRPAYWAHATVVALDPDVMVVTVAGIAPDSTEVPFTKWRDFWSRTRSEYVESRREMLGSEKIGNDDTVLLYFAGDLLPWSEEMYVVSPEPAVASGPLTFVNERAELALGNGKLILIRKGGDVTVTRK